MNKQLKEKIFKLRNEGKSFRQISKILKCSKGSISYHCSVGQKEKVKIRTKNRRLKMHPFLRKIEWFSYQRQNKKQHKYLQISTEKRIYHKIWDFSRKDKNIMLNLNEVLNKIGIEPVCYLTGRKIDINKPNSYHFDHILPSSRGGKNDLDNLGIASKEANQAKSDLTVPEFVELCKDVLINFGYDIRKK